jgi:histidinol-phosphate aminotransferase
VTGKWDPMKAAAPGIAKLDDRHAISGSDVGPRGVYLNLGESTAPPSAGVREALRAEIDRVARYPDTMYTQLCEDLAAYVGGNASPEWITVGSGSDALIELVLKTFGAPGRRAFVPVPTFFVYSRTARLLGLEVVEVRRTGDFGIDAEKLAAATRPEDTVFLANPNNPTGNAVGLEVVEDLVVRARGPVVIDECYYEMWGRTALGLLDENPNAIILRSMSKTFGLAGLRVGYAVAQPATMKALERANQTFPISRVAGAAARAALADADYYRRELHAMARRREDLAQGLSALGLKVHPSVTNFVLVSWGETQVLKGRDLVAELAERNVYVADFSLAPGLGAGYFRTAVGTDDENTRLLEALREIVGPG